MAKRLNDEIELAMNRPPWLTLILRVLRFLLGLLFVCSGVAKIPVLHSVAATIATVTHLSASVSMALGAGTVTLEIAGGLALLLRFRVHAAALLLCLLTAVFLWILASTILQGREIVCNCFGVLGISLPNRMELVLDLAIFDFLAFIAWASSQRVWLSPKRRRRERLIIVLTILVLVYIEYALVQAAFEGRVVTARPALRPAISFAEMSIPGFAPGDAPYRVLVLLSLNDFNCPPCFDDFVALCDSISTHGSLVEGARIVALVRPDNPIASGISARLERWTRAAGIPFPVLVAPDSLFTNLQFNRSAFWVISASGEEIMHHELPIGAMNRERILGYLFR